MMLKTKNTTISFEAKYSIFTIDIMNNAELNIDDFKEMISFFKEVHFEKYYKVLIVSNVNTSADKEGLSYLLNNEYVKQFNKGEAIVSSKFMIQLSAQFYAKVIATSRKVKVFKDKEKAYNWLVNLSI